MEFLEIVYLFAGRDHGIFHSAADDCLSGRCTVLSAGIYYDHIYYCAKTGLWRSCVGLAVSGVHYVVSQRRSIFLHGNSGTISGEDLYGGQKAPDLPGKGETVNLNSFLTA